MTTRCNMKFIILCILLLATSLFGELNMDSKYKEILLIKDGEGVFIYNFFDKKNIEIIPFNNKDIRVDIEQINITERGINITYYDIETLWKANYDNNSYNEYEYFISLPDYECKLSKTIKKTFTDSSIYVKEYNHILNDSTSYSEPRMVEYKKTIMKTQTVDGIHYSSEKGNLFKNNRNNEIELLLKHKKDFSHLSDKFTAGYIRPSLSNDGKKLLFQDTEYEESVNIKTKKIFFSKLWDFFFGESSYWIELDLLTMEQQIYKICGSGVDPSYSKSDRFILFISPVFDSSKDRTHKCYVFDRDAKELHQIPSCTKAFWLY